jgi:tryptophan-rich sensory protein
MLNRPARTQVIGLAGWLAATFVTGAIGAFASASAGTFYGGLVRPDWAPPAWLFGPVWTTLYVLMGIAAWLVWRDHGLRGARNALRLFITQLVVNALWTWIFFVWHQGAFALVEIVVLWLMIAGTLVMFWRLHRLAALLLAPYLAWVSFATALTAALWRLNPAVLG